jgi:acetyltransferase-like isoleucine patch superfamily enzyme
MGLIHKIYQSVNQYRFRLRRKYFSFKGNIKVDKSTIIYPMVVIDNDSGIPGGKVEIGAGSEILYGVCLMTYGGVISIGARCSINPYTVIYGMGKGTIIGNDVLIAGHCLIVPGNHNFSESTKRINEQGWNSKGIIIKDNVWIGSGCRILDGVTIDSGAIVAAGSVVNKNVEKNTIVGGVPAKLIKNRD